MNVITGLAEPALTPLDCPIQYSGRPVSEVIGLAQPSWTPLDCRSWCDERRPARATMEKPTAHAPVRDCPRLRQTRSRLKPQSLMGNIPSNSTTLDKLPKATGKIGKREKKGRTHSSGCLHELPHGHGGVARGGKSELHLKG